MGKSAASIARFKRRMAKIPIEIRAAAAAEALLQAKALADSMGRVVPVEEGLLRSTIRVEEGRRGDRFFVKAGGLRTRKLVRAGASVRYDYALGIELGTKDMRARPFFWPVYRTNKRSIRAGIRATARKAAQRYRAGLGG